MRHKTLLMVIPQNAKSTFTSNFYLGNSSRLQTFIKINHGSSAYSDYTEYERKMKLQKGRNRNMNIIYITMRGCAAPAPDKIFYSPITQLPLKTTDDLLRFAILFLSRSVLAEVLPWHSHRDMH